MQRSEGLTSSAARTGLQDDGPRAPQQAAAPPSSQLASS